MHFFAANNFRAGGAGGEGMKDSGLSISSRRQKVEGNLLRIY